MFGMGSGIFQLREEHEEWLRSMRAHDQKAQREAGRVEHGCQRPWTLSHGCVVKLSSDSAPAFSTSHLCILSLYENLPSLATEGRFPLVYLDSGFSPENMF